MNSYIKSTGNLESIQIAEIPVSVLSSTNGETDGQAVEVPEQKQNIKKKKKTLHKPDWWW